MNKKIREKRKTPSQHFYLKTKIKNFPKEDVPSEDWPASWKRIYSKEYPRFNKVGLPKSLPLIKTSLSETLFNRKSQREFSGQKISMEKLASLLFFSAGVIPEGKEWNYSRRFYPSAGARYPLEIYISIKNVTNLKNGLYHYNIRQHSLDILWNKGNLNETIANYAGQNWLSNANAIIMISVVFQRNQIKYSDRGLRYILIDSGHLGQNIYLVGTAIGLKICAVGGFIDDKINKILDINGEDEGTLYIVAVGI